MKIAIIHPSLVAKGGAENVVIWLAEELVRQGHVVDVYTTDYDAEFYGPKRGKSFQIIELKLGGYAIRPLVWFKSGWLLRHRLGGYDVVNPHNFPAYIWVYIAKKLNPQIPKIVWFCEEPVRAFYRNIIDKHVHQVLLTDRQFDTPETVLHKFQRKFNEQGWKFFMQYISDQLEIHVWNHLAKKMDQSVVPKLDLILTNSQYISDTVTLIFHVRSYTCLLGIPVDRFSPKKDVTYDNYLFTPSRLFYEKNIFNILRAVKILADQQQFPFDRYVIAGKGPLMKQLRKFVADNGLDQLVNLAGFVSEEELESYYAHAGVVAYLPVDETYGLVFPEAGLYRKPVLGPRQGGPQEIVLDGITGLLADPLDPEDIAKKMLELSKDKQRMKNMGMKNEKFVRTHLTIERFTSDFLALINKES